MAAFEQSLVLLLTVTGLSVLGRFLPWPLPITYVLGGLAASVVPGYPPVVLDPGFFFLCFLPPLLFSDGWLMPLREFAQARRPILVLAIGLVALTTLVVGLVAQALVPGLPPAMAFALGALISPTDAVAVGAITEKLKVPTRLTIILNGESLMNDATGLVAFKFALAALIAGTFSLAQLGLSFLLISLGGLAVGLVVALLVGWLRDLLRKTVGEDASIETTLSLLTPFGAYLAAERVHTSGILAIVAAGLYSGWRDPLKMTPQTRQTAWNVWATLLFWLNGLAFVLLGLQFLRVYDAVRDDYSLVQLLAFGGVIAAVAIAVRVVWFFGGAYLPFLCVRSLRFREQPPSWQAVLVGGWAGIRGTVTLAAALSLPLVLPDGSPLPGRDIVIFLSFAVILVTLVVQGTTLEALIRLLGLRGDGIRSKEELLARTKAVEAGLQVLRAAENDGGDAASLGHVVAEYEARLAELAAEGETRSSAARRRADEKRYRLAALAAERATIDRLWREDVIADDVHRPLQQLLDHEETLLRGLPEQ